MVSKTFSRDEVAQHSTTGDLWVVIDSRVYDLSNFAPMHPGGLAVLLDSEIAGQDATEQFFALHRVEVLDRYARFQIGTIEGEQLQVESRASGSLSKVPYAEPTWLSPGYHSPYYKEHHRRFQKAYRKFIDEVVFPDAQARESDGRMPSKKVFDEKCRLNLLAMQIGPGKHLEGRVLMDGAITLEEASWPKNSVFLNSVELQFDPFIELIMVQEGARLHARGYSDGLAGGTIIGLPPVINFAQPALRDRVVEDALSGRKPICLAVTEAFAGSDVQGIRTRATKTPDGSWLVNGTKKWITNAVWAHYFTTACKTDSGEIIVLVIERGEGVRTTPIKTLYSSAAGTAFVTFDNVRVPDANRLGAGLPGLNIIIGIRLSHFRWALVAHDIARQRVIFEECFKWVTQRKAFEKPLSSQAVIRQKLASMISRFESCQSWLENITFQMCQMSSKEQAQHLAGQTAFLKTHATRAAQQTAADAVQMFGGRALTQTGMGRFIEHVNANQVPILTVATAEDVLGDLGVRQALRNMPRTRL
ncbi:acyl-CoA dehydrogenase/oxidase, partial [Mycena pura]